jgi:hypothetical protein
MTGFQWWLVAVGSLRLMQCIFLILILQIGQNILYCVVVIVFVEAFSFFPFLFFFFSFLSHI